MASPPDRSGESSLSRACANVSAASWNDALAVIASPSRAEASPRLAASRPFSMSVFASLTTSATGATPAITATMNAPITSLTGEAEPGRAIALELCARHFDDEHQHHERGQRAAQPQRHHRASGEHADDRQQDLRDHEQDHRFARRPAEHGQPVHEVIGAVRAEWVTAAEPVDGDDRGVDEQDRDQHRWRQELPRRARHHVDREHADRERVPDREPSGPAHEERRRPHVEREEGEAAGEQTERDGREVVLPAEAGEREQPGRRRGTDPGGETVDVAETVGGLGDHHDEAEGEHHVERLDTGGAEARPGGDRDRGRDRPWPSS